MHIFGLDISFSKSKDESFHNGRYISEAKCDERQRRIVDQTTREIASLKGHIDQRIDDLKDFVLRNGNNRR